MSEKVFNNIPCYFVLPATAVCKKEPLLSREEALALRERLDRWLSWTQYECQCSNLEKPCYRPPDNICHLCGLPDKSWE